MHEMVSDWSFFDSKIKSKKKRKEKEKETFVIIWFEIYLKS